MNEYEINHSLVVGGSVLDQREGLGPSWQNHDVYI